MNKLIYAIIGILILVVVGFLVYKSTNLFQKERPGALQVSTLPKANIFLDNKQVGASPLIDNNLKSGEYDLKIQGIDDSKNEWTGKIKISSETMTAVDVQFQPDNQKEVEILSLEAINENKPQLLVITIPDETKIFINNEEKGSSPLILKEISEGEQKITIEKEGYSSKTIKAKTVNKYRLTLYLEMIKGNKSGIPLENKEKTATESAKLTNKETIIIKETETGWLRVRIEPSLDSSEAARVNPGQEFPYLGEKEGWTKIEYEKGKVGWVSSQYVEKKGETTAKPSPTPTESTPSPTPEPTESTPSPTPTV